MRDSNEMSNFLTATFRFQFGSKIAQILETLIPQFKFVFSKKTKKIKHILHENVLFASYRPPLGTFSLSLHAGKLILPQLSVPTFRVVVEEEISDYIKEGKSVFCKHVIKYDPNLKIGNEVFVVSPTDELLALGKMMIPPDYISFFTNGVAVRVRKGILKEK